MLEVLTALFSFCKDVVENRRLGLELVDAVEHRVMELGDEFAVSFEKLVDPAFHLIVRPELRDTVPVIVAVCGEKHQDMRIVHQIFVALSPIVLEVRKVERDSELIMPEDFTVRKDRFPEYFFLGHRPKDFVDTVVRKGYSVLGLQNLAEFSGRCRGMVHSRLEDNDVTRCDIERIVFYHCSSM